MRVGLSRIIPAALTALIVGVSSLALAAPLASNDEAMTEYGVGNAPLQMITATVGNPCSNSTGSTGAAVGAMAFTTDGKLLTCQSGSWVVAQADEAYMGNPGYTKMPSGLMIQFGSYGSFGATGFVLNKEQRFEFKRPFPSTCITVSTSHMWSFSGGTGGTWEAVKSCDKFGVTFKDTLPSRSWIAIGY